MVSSAILGAAAGTGLALVVAFTIVVYRYYSVKNRGKYWSSLDRWPDLPDSKKLSKIHQDVIHHSHQQHFTNSPGDFPATSKSAIEDSTSRIISSKTLQTTSGASHVFDCWRKPQQSYYAVQPRALVKVPDKLSEVFGDVLELACRGGGGSGSGTGPDKSGSGAASTVGSKIGMVTGVAIIRGRWAQRGSRSPLSSVATNDSADSSNSGTSSEEFNVAKDHHAVQPSVSAMLGEPGGSLGHQSRSCPSSGAGGRPTSGSGGRVLARNQSVSSQSSLEGASGPLVHRGSSPQIRAFGPDGRHHYHDSAEAAASSYPPSRSSRSPSPARAVSLDARCASPASLTPSIHSGTGSPSQSSVSALATGTSSSCGSSSMGAARSGVRCLSPLLIPPPRSSVSSEGGPAPPASPLGSLQPDLYQRRDGPLFLSARRTGKSLGRLHLRIKYDFDRSDLHVHLIEAHDLAGSDQGGFNDPYVKLTLSPEVDTRKRQTPIHRNDPNPFFDQHFKFPVSHQQLQEKMLLLQVFDYDRFSRNDVVGSVRVAMEELELVSSTCSIEVWGEIAREKKPPEEIQQVLLSLSYLPSAERLTVLILKARNLFPPQEREILDPFVKVSLLTGDKRVKKKKTAVRKATRCPVWNEAMSFNVTAGALASSAIEVCVLDSSNELIGGNAIVGSCIVGPAIGGATPSSVLSESEVTNQSREHWLHMSHSPRKAIAMWHTLH